MAKPMREAAALVAVEEATRMSNTSVIAATADLLLPPSLSSSIQAETPPQVSTAEHSPAIDTAEASLRSAATTVSASSFHPTGTSVGTSAADGLMPPPRRSPKLSHQRSKEQALVCEAIKSLAAGAHRHRGGCPTLEDEFAVHHDRERGLACFGVYDGHAGASAARYLKEHLHAHVSARLAVDADDACDDAAARRALADAFRQCDDALIESRCEAGTTAAVLLLRGGGRCLHVAWCGDCRAVLCRGGSAVRLTQADHRPGATSAEGRRECARVERDGGFVAGGRVGGVLEVSRALGGYDPAHGGKLPGVTAQPEMVSEALRADDEFIILGSDGLWEVLQTDEAVRLARAELRTYGDEQMAAEKLIHAALARRVDDNVSAVVVRLFSSQEPIGPRSPTGNSAFRRSSFVHLPTPSSFVRVVGGFEDR